MELCSTSPLLRSRWMPRITISSSTIQWANIFLFNPNIQFILPGLCWRRLSEIVQENRKQKFCVFSRVKCQTSWILYLWRLHGNRWNWCQGLHCWARLCSCWGKEVTSTWWEGGEKFWGKGGQVPSHPIQQGEAHCEEGLLGFQSNNLWFWLVKVTKLGYW